MERERVKATKRRRKEEGEQGRWERGRERRKEGAVRTLKETRDRKYV